jgi:hypothetical protein
MNDSHMSDFPDTTWDSVPPALRRSAKKSFLIPPDIRSTLLPVSQTSLKELADFILPSLQVKVPDNSAFFSNVEPVMATSYMIAKLRYLPIPNEPTIRKLFMDSQGAWLRGCKSIMYSHLDATEQATTTFPLWILTFWRDVVDARRLVVQWAACKDWVAGRLQQKKSAAVRELAEQASVMMTALPHGSSKPAGLSDTAPIHGTWRYLGPHWLEAEQIDDLLELLRNKILDNPTLAATMHTARSSLITKILTVFDNRARGDYHVEKNLQWIRSIGNDISQNKVNILTAVHLKDVTNSQHWVPLIIHAGGNEFHYGDSFGSPMPPRLQDALTWWISQHRTSFQLPTIIPLPITIQTDGHSCGMLTINSLRHFIDPFRFPLAGGSRESGALERLEAFNMVSTHIVTRVRTSQFMQIRNAHQVIA